LINELFDWCFDFIFIVVIYSAAEAKRQLIDAGFDLLNENEEWELKPGGRYFFTRNMSCLVAFDIGEK
jgi:aspartyl aminopeptidase